MPYITFSKLGTHGRLGNQMFQVAATISYALHNLQPFHFYKWKCSYSGEDYAKYFPLLDVGANLSKPVSLNLPSYQEPTFHYHPIPQFTDGVDLFGYFQSSKHFLGHDNYVRDILTPKIKAISKQNEQTLAIHVRRTDYKTTGHGTLPIEYYQDAIKLMDTFGKIKRIWVFSDDIAWCKTNFSDNRCKFIEGNSAIYDLALMASCQRFVIANSSFSWWGAFLAKPHKIVIAPDKWFKESVDSDKDIFEPYWIKIPAKYE